MPHLPDVLCAFFDGRNGTAKKSRPLLVQQLVATWSTIVSLVLRFEPQVLSQTSCSWMLC